MELNQEEQDLLDVLEGLDAKNLSAVPQKREQMFQEAAANFASKEASTLTE